MNIFVFIIWVYFKKSYPKNDDNFKKTRFNYFSRLVITEILMNLMSCHGFVKSSISNFILICINALVPYYPSKGFVVVETEVGGFDNIPITVKLKKSMLLLCMKRRVF